MSDKSENPLLKSHSTNFSNYEKCKIYRSTEWVIFDPNNRMLHFFDDGEQALKFFNEGMPVENA